MGIFKLMDLSLGANISFQQIHRVVLNRVKELKRLNSKPLDRKGSSGTAHQDVEQSPTVHDESICIAGVNKPKALCVKVLENWSGWRLGKDFEKMSPFRIWAYTKRFVIIFFILKALQINEILFSLDT